jgi:DNA-binding transcriptional LysR family regulator
MDLSLVRTFGQVVESQSFTVAARTLGLPKSSVSRAVARLEEQLGARLLERTSRQFRLTASGRAYYDGVARALSALTDAEHAVAESQGEPRGLVRLTVPTGLDRSFLSDLVTGFVSHYPAIQVHVSFTNRKVDLVAEEFDLAIRGSARQLQDSSLIARKVAQLSAWLFAAPAYLNGRQLPRRPVDLKKHDIILGSLGGDTDTWELMGPNGLEPVEIKGGVYSDDAFFIRELVLRGAGIALMVPRTDDLQNGALVRVLPDYEVQGLSAYVVMPSARHLPRRVALFRDALIEAFKTLPGYLSGSATGARPAGT